MLDKFKLPIGFRGRSSFYVQTWWLVQSTLFFLSPQFMYGWRRFLLRLFGANIGSGVLIRPTVRITYPWKVVIGHHAWIGDDVVLYSLGTIIIGSHSVISQRSYICAGSHDVASKEFRIIAEPIIVEEGVWVASDVFVAPGVTIGKNSVIGARSSVFSDVKPDYIYMGTPAKAVRERVFNDK